ncbi:histidine-containing phosphotransfer protein 2-like [Ipomoea triloba]|uniref:histidine-containing phosphotransfer protein 2-like n=1 Tax=Ipomoea triloba TaxID=35885 RepID=UPI00125D7135|nr:histidine-containing phosphotransfer protein 2-like [Ipomoea triloba]
MKGQNHSKVQRRIGVKEKSENATGRVSRWRSRRDLQRDTVVSFQIGYVDEYLQICYGLKETSGLTFFLELIATFLTNSASTIHDMTQTMEYPILDYDKMQRLANRLKGSSACIGACRISASCSELSQATTKRSKIDCKRAVEMINREKSAWEIKLETIMQLEHDAVIYTDF